MPGLLHPPFEKQPFSGLQQGRGRLAPLEYYRNALRWVPPPLGKRGESQIVQICRPKKGCLPARHPLGWGGLATQGTRTVPG